MCSRSQAPELDGRTPTAVALRCIANGGVHVEVLTDAAPGMSEVELATRTSPWLRRGGLLDLRLDTVAGTDNDLQPGLIG